MREHVFTQRRTDFHLGPSLPAQTVAFLRLGTEHIFTGYDHVPFVIGLLAIWRGAMHILKVVTAFTLAHSITLILAALSAATLPSRLVESVIALSIAYVRVENIFVTNLRARWRVAFLFGLMYGFGFAEVLREMGLPSRGLVLSLLSFNVGVGLGQLVIVATCFPIIYYVNPQAFAPLLVRGASAAIFLAEMIWFIERTFLAA